MGFSFPAALLARMLLELFQFNYVWTCIGISFYSVSLSLFFLYFLLIVNKYIFLSLEFGKIIYLCGAICLSISSYFKRICNKNTNYNFFSIKDLLLVLLILLISQSKLTKKIIDLVPT